MPASGGSAERITVVLGGQRPLESRDGKSVFYLALDGTGVRSVPVVGGPSTLAAAPVHRYPNGFTLTSEGLYYGAPPHSDESRFVMFASFSDGITRPVALVRYPFYVGMSVSPDNRYIVFDLADQSDRDLLMAWRISSLLSERRGSRIQIARSERGRSLALLILVRFGLSALRRTFYRHLLRKHIVLAEIDKVGSEVHES